MYICVYICVCVYTCVYITYLIRVQKDQRKQNKLSNQLYEKNFQRLPLLWVDVSDGGTPTAEPRCAHEALPRPQPRAAGRGADTECRRRPQPPFVPQLAATGAYNCLKARRWKCKSTWFLSL